MMFSLDLINMKGETETPTVVLLGCSGEIMFFFMLTLGLCVFMSVRGDQGLACNQFTTIIDFHLEIGKMGQALAEA